MLLDNNWHFTTTWGICSWWNKRLSRNWLSTGFTPQSPLGRVFWPWKWSRFLLLCFQWTLFHKSRNASKYPGITFNACSFFCIYWYWNLKNIQIDTTISKILFCLWKSWFTSCIQVCYIRKQLNTSISSVLNEIVTFCYYLYFVYT